MEHLLNVHGMSCSHCEGAVKKGLAGIAGVSEVVVDLGAKTVLVKCDEQVAVDDIKNCIEDLGFDVG